jgi:hypothetical protein
MVVDHRFLEDLDQRASAALGLAQQLGRAVDVVRPHHDVDVAGLGGDELAVFLGKAARHDYLTTLASVLPGPEVAEVAVELVVGVLADAARVEHDDVGIVLRFGADQPVGLEQAGDALGVVLVHLAPVGAQDVTAGHGQRG